MILLKKSIAHFLFCFLFLIAIYFLFKFFLFIQVFAFEQYDLTIPEGSLIYSISAFSNNIHELYRDYSAIPYATTPYTPIYYVIVGSAAKILKSSTEEIYILARCLSIFSTFISALFIKKIYQELADPDFKTSKIFDLTAWFAFLVPFSILNLIPWGFTVRPDMLALSFSLISFYIFLRRKSFYHILFSAFFALLSFYTKQSFVSVFLAISCILAARKEYKNLMFFFFSYVLSLSLCFCFLDFFTKGLFAKNTIAANVAPIIWQNLKNLPLGGFVFSSLFIFSLSFSYIIFQTLKREKPSIKLIDFFTYLSFACIVSITSVVKDGADINYFLEPLFLISLLSSFAVVLFYKNLIYFAFCLPLLFGYVFAGGYSHGLRYTEYPLLKTREMANDPSLIKFQEAFKNKPEKTIVYINAGQAVRATQKILLLDSFNARYLEKMKRIKTNNLADKIYKKEIDFVITENTRAPDTFFSSHWWPTSIREALLVKYFPISKSKYFQYWVPKKN